MGRGGSSAVRRRPAAARGAGAAKRPAAPARKRPAAAGAMESAADSGLQGPSREFQELLAEHLLEAMYKQCHLEDVVNERPWSLCLDPGQRTKFGKLCFGDDLAFECQVLGSESYESNTWLWAWANPSIPEDMSGSARTLCSKQAGKALPSELSEAQFPLGIASGHQIAAVACGMMGSAAYFSGPTDPVGRVFVLITDAGFPAPTRTQAEEAVRLVRCIGQALELGWVSTPVAAVDAFLKKFGAKMLQDGSYELPGGSSLKLEVNKDRRLKSIATTVQGA
mmetsp:Transcript_106698/g.296982  ORF Transcript_106698/g.296982 Transcript_106698/m.296982 type:complete len:280 (-) Transcript_106698:246-1085(-)